MHSLSKYDMLKSMLYDGQRGPSATWWSTLFLLTRREGGFIFSLLFEEGGGYMGLYEIASLVLQAATLLVGILALCESRKK